MTQHLPVAARPRRFAGVNRLFLATVVFPTTIAVVYFGFIASDIYVSESHFVVRSPQRQAVAGLGALLAGAGFSRAQDDTYTVHDYMKSRDALGKLNRGGAFEKAFDRPSVDRFSRFNGFGIDHTAEALFRYYQKQVGLDLDTTSSISTLRVSAFSAQEAQRINESLLQMGETLINDLNERGRADMIKFAQSEVDTASRQAAEAARALSIYRGAHAVFDPERQSALQLQMIAKVQDELIQARTQLAQMVAIAPGNPQIPALRNRVASIETEMRDALAKVVNGDGSLSGKNTEYERLALQNAFADKQLVAAMALLEQARNDAQRKQLYLERVVQPSLPDYPVEPRRIRWILTVFVLGLAAWGILSLFLASLREHQD